jgi:hypothetical protein
VPIRDLHNTTDYSSSTCIFAYNGFYAGRAELGGTSSWELTWLDSLKKFFGERLVEFNPDSYGPEDHGDSDSALLRLVDDVHPQHLFMIYNPGQGWDREFIGRTTLQALRDRGVKIGAIWGDVQLPAQRRSVRELRDIVDINICTASDSASARFGSKVSTLYCWVPVSDPRLPRVDRCNCGASLSYAGSYKGRRASIVDYVKAAGISIHTGGGEAGAQLSRPDFVKLLAHDFGLSFSGHSAEALTNARTFEIVNQGSLLLEEWGRETAKWLKPFEEYIPWFNKRDLVQKVRYFERNPAEASEIGARAHSKWLAMSDDVLWMNVLRAADDGRRGAQNTRAFIDPLRPSLVSFGRARRSAVLVGEALTRTPLSEPWFTAAYYSSAARHGIPRRIRSSIRARRKLE